MPPVSAASPTPLLAPASPVDERAWLRVGLLLFAVGWGANHFAALLQVYRQHLALDAAAPALLFGVYALGLMPGLLLAGPLSDRRGRRAVVLPAAVAALGASALLGALGDHFFALLVGRFLYGLAAGAVTSPGSVWLLELSARSAQGAQRAQAAAAGLGPRRAAIALSAGFGAGPLVTGVMAQWLPAPTIAPYAVHVAVLTMALAAAWRVADGNPERAASAAANDDRRLLRFDLDRAGWRRFLGSVALMAPWVFAFPSIAFAVLPALLGGGLGPAPIAYTGLLCALTLGAGVLAQPVTRNLAAASAARLGLAIGAVGLLLGAGVEALGVPALLLGVVPVLGAAYGICITAGLRGAQAIAPAHARGGLTGLYYVLTYVGFSAPYLFAIATRALSPVTSLALAALLAAATAVALRSDATR